MNNRNLYIGIIGTAYQAMQMISYKIHRAEGAEPAEAVVSSEAEVGWLRDRINIRVADNP